MAIPNKDTILLFGAGSGQLPYLRHFRECGYRVVAIDRDTGALGAAEADLLLAVSTHDDQAIRERINEADQKNRIAAVACPSTGWAYVSAARIATWLGVAFPSEEGVLNILDKFRMWQKLTEIGLTRRQCMTMPAGTDMGQFLPAVVKPRMLGGASKGVYHCDSPMALADAVTQAAALSPDGQALVESFCPGEEVKLAGFLQQGKVAVAVIARRSFGPGVLGVPIGLAIGPVANGRGIDPSPPLVELLERFCRHVGLFSTPFNVDIILDKEQPELIDFDIVLGSFRTLMAKGCDIDTLELYSRLCLGEALPKAGTCRRGAAVTYLWCEGTNDESENLLRACRKDTCGGEFIPDAGFTRASVASSAPLRVGAFISEGDTLEAAARAGQNWLEKVQVHLERLGSEACVIFPVNSFRNK